MIQNQNLFVILLFQQLCHKGLRQLKERLKFHLDWNYNAYRQIILAGYNLVEFFQLSLHVWLYWVSLLSNSHSCIWRDHTTSYGSTNIQYLLMASNIMTIFEFISTLTTILGNNKYTKPYQPHMWSENVIWIKWNRGMKGKNLIPQD